MKITVNKAKIKKLATYAKSQRKSGTFWANIFIHAGRAWAMNGMTLLSCPFEGESKSISINERAFSELIEKAGGGKDIEIELDNAADYTEPLGSGIFKLFDAVVNTAPIAKISRMLWALIQPKGAGEICNLLVTSNQIKAELYEFEIHCEQWKFRGGCELAESNQIEKPLLLTINDKKFQPITKKKSADFSLIVCENFQNRCLLAYEGEGGIDVYTYCPYFEQTGNIDESKRYHFSDEIKSAYKSAIEQMKEQSEPTTEPEPTNIEPIKTTESEESKMQEKKEIEPTETTMEKPAAESIQTSEPTPEPTPEPTAATAAESTSEPEPEKENRPPIVSKAAPDISEIIELYKNFDDYKANDKLEKLFLKEQEEKGFLYFSEIVEICKAINAGAWNTFFYCHPMHFGATWNKTPEPGAQVIIGDSVYSCEDRLGYSDEERAKNCQICGNSRAQYKIHFWLEVMEPLKPSEKVEKVKDCWDKSRIGNPIVMTPADALNPEVKAMVKTINDYKRIVGSLFGVNHNYNSVLSQIFHYYRDCEEITGKEPGGASRIDDYTIERVPNHNAIIVNFTLTSKKSQPKNKPEKKQEELKPTPAPIEIKREPEPVKAAVASIPAPVVACKVDATVAIPEPEPKLTTEEPDPEQIDKSKPTGAELRYSLSLLAMPYPIDTLIEKFLKKTNKPVRYSIVEKLLMTIDRGSVPKPGESKREFIKTYYQTH